MRLSRNAVQKAVAGVVIGSGLALAGAAQAAMIYDLRFDDASHTKVLNSGSVGQNYSLQLWVRVTGSDGYHTTDGLQSGMVVVKSAQLGGGALTSGGLATVIGPPNPPFPPAVVSPGFITPFDTGNPQLGTASDLNGDSIMDWGSNDTAQGNTNYMIFRSPSMTIAGGTAGHAIDANTWEFEVAQFTVNVGSVGTGTTDFNLVKPNATGYSFLVGTIDDLTPNTTPNYTSQTDNLPYANGLGVSFVVPEPASLSLLGLGAIGLLGRRRKGKKA